MHLTHSPFARANASVPIKVNVLYFVGSAFIETGEFRVAVKILTKALKLRSSNELMVADILQLQHRAFPYSNIENLRNVVGDCYKVLSVTPRLLRAESYAHLDEWEKSAEDYEFASRTDEVKDDCEFAAFVQSKLEHVKAKIRTKHAEQKNANGNEQFSLTNFHLAAKMYTEAIDLWSTKVHYYYENRSTEVLYCWNRYTCFIMLGEYRRALQDAKHVLTIDQNSTMGYKRMAKCCLILGDYEALEKMSTQVIHTKSSYEYELCKKLHSFNNRVLQSYKDRRYYSAGMFNSVMA